MKCLVVIAHPLAESLCSTLAARTVEALNAAGHQVVVEDLYKGNFNAVLTAVERQSYYHMPYDCSAVQGEVERLLAAEAMVLLFPTWWFGFPAILKGWLDRVWGPGIAYDHASDYGPIKPKLLHLRRMLVVTTLGSPWWVDLLVMRQPVKKVIKSALLQACAPKCKLEMLSLYKSESLTDTQVKRFTERVVRSLDSWV